MPAGTIKAEGEAKGDTFQFAWKNKKGMKFEMLLKKKDETTIHARWETLDSIGPMTRPYRETILKRK